MGLRALIGLSLACGMLSLGACADILGLGDFSIGGDGGNASTTTTSAGGSGAGGSGAAVSDGGMGDGGNNITGPGSTTTGVGGGGMCGFVESYAELVLCDQPVLYLRFEEDDPSVAFNEVPGLVGDGTCGSAVGKTEGVLGIGGVASVIANDRCEVPDPDAQLAFTPFAPYTVEAWIRADDSQELNTFGFIGTWDGSQGHSLFAFPGSMEAGDQPNIELKRNTIDYAIQCLSLQECQTSLFNDYRHVVGTYNELMEARIYLDGQLLVSGGLDNALGISTVPFAVVGPSSASGTQTVTFDEVAVYQRALSDNEVKSHFDCGVGNGCENAD